jgi:Carboxypeptidase regulatory-like domain/TonB dependent receptor-like, beta-barrel
MATPKAAVRDSALVPRHEFAATLSGLAILLIALVLLPAGAFGQSQAINGTIRGRVSDPSGSAIPMASVTVVNNGTGFKRTVTSNDSGYYVIPNLPLGTYTVTVEKDGFAVLKAPNVVLEAGREAVIDAAMKLASVATEVEVTGGAPIVEPSKVDVGRTIGTREVENLPLTSRNPYNFILFQPGVTGHPNPELGIPRTLNTNGLMDRINYQLDGMVDTETDRHGLRLFPISNSYVREVQTVSNSYAPEFGNTAGDIYNVITNSGTNNIHGMFEFIHRWQGATAYPILSTPGSVKPDLQLDDYSANAGGPFIKDRLFWFAAYEHLTRGQPAPNTITAANATALGLDPSLLAPAPGLEHAQFLDYRTDWTINNKNQMFIRYNYFRNEFPYNSGVGGQNALDAAADFHDRAHVFGMQIVSTITSNLLNEFRASWSYRNEKHVAGSLTGPGPQVVISGIATFNGSSSVGDRFQEKIPNFNENLTWIHGSHTLKFGLGWQKNVDVQASDTYTQYNFATIAAYQAAESGANPYAYNTVVASNGGGGLHYDSQFWDFYGQDSWQVTPKLLLNYGIRYDKYLPSQANPNAPFVDSQNFASPSGDVAPRVGLAYRLTENTVVRASAGIFYDPPATNQWYLPLLNDGSPSSSQTYLSTTSGAPPFPTIVSSLPPVPGAITSLTTLMPNYKDARTYNANLQVTRELTPNDALTVGYVYTGGRDLLYLYNSNLINPTGFLADGRPIFSSAVSASTRLYPQFNNISMQASGANSDYNALLVTYNHRLSQGIDINASYTWMHAISDAPDVNSFEQSSPIEDPTDLARDRGNSTINRPQSLTVSAVLQPQFKFSGRVSNAIMNNNMFAILGNFSSGDEQNIVANQVLNGDSTTSSVTRPVFVGRNTARGPNIYQIDLRYTRTFNVSERFKPQVFIEANNLFNHPNITSLNTKVTVGSDPKLPSYGYPVDLSNNVIPLPTSFGPLSTVLEGRIVQVGLTARF